MILTNLLSRLWARGQRQRVAKHGAIDDLLQRGYGCQQAGQRADAERYYRRALALDARSVDAHYLLGALLGESGDLDAAALHLDQALAGKADFAKAHVARGNIYILRGERRAARASYELALRYDPVHAAAHFNLGLLIQNENACDKALQHYECAYGHAPDIPDLLRNLTLALIEHGRYEDAKLLLGQVPEHAPRFLDALKCMGLVLQKMHRPEEALQYYLRARAMDGNDPELFNNFGIVLQDLGRLDSALEHYSTAIALRPDFVLARFHRALAYLLRHEFARGWPDYELRFKSADQPQRPTQFPVWDGGALAGKRLLVFAEQGLGDEIMFASCLPDVVAASEQCFIECSDKLETLLRRSFPRATVYVANADKALPRIIHEANIDLQIPIGSLPLHLRSTRADFPRHRGYLQADPRLTSDWQKRLAALGPGLKVGISWQGGTYKSRQPVRSLPLARWSPILQSRNAQFVDLQYTENGVELGQVRATTGVVVHSWDEVRTDYEQTAALVMALDLVISVCTAVIHLGGALGKPVWVMAPYIPEWRYGLAGEVMPWYPSVRIFRQPAYGEWDTVIRQIAQSLRESTGVGNAQAMSVLQQNDARGNTQ